RYGGRRKGVESVESAKFNMMSQAGVVVHVAANAFIPDAGMKPHREVILRGVESEVIIIVDEHGVGKQPRTEQVIPTKGSRCIAPWDVGGKGPFLAHEIKNVPTKIAAQVQPVP